MWHGWCLGCRRSRTIVFAEDKWVFGVFAILNYIGLVALGVGTTVVSILVDTGILDGLEGLLAVGQGYGTAASDDGDCQVLVTEHLVGGVTGATVECFIAGISEGVFRVERIHHVGWLWSICWDVLLAVQSRTGGKRG